MAEHAKGLAIGSIKAKRDVAEEERRLCDSVTALYRLRTSSPEGLAPQELQHRICQCEADVKRHTHAYQQTYFHWLGNQHWHKVVELYELALIKEIAAQRPPLVELPPPSVVKPGQPQNRESWRAPLVELSTPSWGVHVDYEALSPHLERVAVELADCANTRARASNTSANGGGKDNNATPEVAHPVVRGVSLIDCALHISDDNPESAKNVKKRWHRSRNPKLPDPIGMSPHHKQRGLFNIDQMVDFINQVDSGLVDRNRLRTKLYPIRTEPEKPSPKPSAPSPK